MFPYLQSFKESNNLQQQMVTVSGLHVCRIRFHRPCGRNVREPAYAFVRMNGKSATQLMFLFLLSATKSLKTFSKANILVPLKTLPYGGSNQTRSASSRTERHSGLFRIKATYDKWVCFGNSSLRAAVCFKSSEIIIRCFPLQPGGLTEALPTPSAVWPPASAASCQSTFCLTGNTTSFSISRPPLFSSTSRGPNSSIGIIKCPLGACSHCIHLVPGGKQSASL